MAAGPCGLFFFLLHYKHNFVTARLAITGLRADAIARSVEESLAAGRLRPGEVLPPVRTLAASLGVSPTTVAAAYRALRQRGVVLGEGRRGTRIANRAGAMLRLPIPVAEGARNLADGNPARELLPDLDPVLHRLSFSRDLYGERPVVPEFEAAARRLLEADGIEAPALSVMSGAMDAIERVLATQLRPGDRVAVEDPAFAGVLDLLAALGLEPVPFAIDDEGADPDAVGRVLERGVTCVIVTPRAQNPMGAATSPARATELRKVLDRHPSTLLIEDDHAAGVAGSALVTLASRRRPRHAYVRSMAKALGPDVRVAILAGAADVVEKVEARQAIGMRWVSRLLQRLVAGALADETVLAAVRQAEREYAKRRSGLLDALAARGLEAHGRSGLNVWIPVREEAAAVQGLALAGWSVAPGERFRVRSGPGLRVTVSRLGPEETLEFAEAAARALKPSRSGGMA